MSTLSYFLMGHIKTNDTNNNNNTTTINDNNSDDDDDDYEQQATAQQNTIVFANIYLSMHTHSVLSQSDIICTPITDATHKFLVFFHSFIHSFILTLFFPIFFSFNLVRRAYTTYATIASKSSLSLYVNMGFHETQNKNDKKIDLCF